MNTLEYQVGPPLPWTGEILLKPIGRRCDLIKRCKVLVFYEMCTPVPVLGFSGSKLMKAQWRNSTSLQQKPMASGGGRMGVRPLSTRHG